MIWWPYARVFRHRGVSHMPLVGTFTRIAYLGCVAYAIIGALVARTLIFPVGMLAEVPTSYRLIAITTALIVFYGLGKQLWLGILVGVGTLLALVTFVSERMF